MNAIYWVIKSTEALMCVTMWTSNTLFWIKEAKHKRSHGISFHLYKKANLEKKEVSGCLGMG